MSRREKEKEPPYDRSGSPPSRCPDAADTNDDGRIQIADVVSLLNYLFAGGAAPAAPGPDACGEDPSADALPGCEGLCR